LNATIVGFISLIQRLVSIPSALIGNSLGNVFYQEISRIKKEDSYNLIFKFTLKLFIYSLFFYLLIYILLNNYFVFIFGESWEGAVTYIKYLLIVGMFSFVFSPLSTLFNYFEIQNYNFIWQFLWLISNIAIFMLYEVYNFSIETLFLIYTIKQSLLYAIGIISFLIYAKGYQHVN
jgi:O-antigen/teichoic acid export membrane protein